MPSESTIVDTVSVDRVELLSPNFARIWFAGPRLRDFGTPGETFDQRIKLVFPGANGTLPDLGGAGDGWWDAWLAYDEADRGIMRTYSVRDIVGEGDATRVAIDFVLHLEPGRSGPASTWAAGAAVGDRLVIMGPRRGVMNGGIEFTPEAGAEIVLAGDETAAPAIARILADVDPATRGAAFIEVPTAADVLTLDAPPAVTVRWLPRDGAALGTELIPAVLDHLGDTDDEGAIRDVETDDLVWETPVFSGLGEQIPEAAAGTSVWIAGESAVVTTLRRHLVRDLGMDRARVAFMGYWRRGVPMRG